MIRRQGLVLNVGATLEQRCKYVAVPILADLFVFVQYYEKDDYERRLGATGAAHCTAEDGSFL